MLVPGLCRIHDLLVVSFTVGCFPKKELLDSLECWYGWAFFRKNKNVLDKSLLQYPTDFFTGCARRASTPGCGFWLSSGWKTDSLKTQLKHGWALGLDDDNRTCFLFQRTSCGSSRFWWKSTRCENSSTPRSVTSTTPYPKHYPSTVNPSVGNAYPGPYRSCKLRPASQTTKTPVFLCCVRMHQRRWALYGVQ